MSTRHNDSHPETLMRGGAESATVWLVLGNYRVSLPELKGDNSDHSYVATFAPAVRIDKA